MDIEEGDEDEEHEEEEYEEKENKKRGGRNLKERNRYASILYKKWKLKFLNSHILNSEVLKWMQNTFIKRVQCYKFIKAINYFYFITIKFISCFNS